MSASLSGPIAVHLITWPLLAWGLERLVETAASRLKICAVSHSLQDGLARLPQVKPDVLVLDLDSEPATQAVLALRAATSAKLLILSSSDDLALHDSVVLAGASGIVLKREPPAVLLKAIEKVHEGEIWIERDATQRIFMELARNKSKQATDPAVNKIASLTRREHQIVAALVSDTSASGKVVAARLNLSEHTLRNHLTSIYSKLGLSNRTDLYAFAHQHGLANTP